MLIILWVPEQTNKNKVQTEQALRRGPVKLQCATLRKCVWVGVGVAGGEGGGEWDLKGRLRRECC